MKKENEKIVDSDNANDTASRTLSKLREKSDQSNSNSLWSISKGDIKFILIFVTIFSLCRFFVYDYYIVPSSSMVPTLLIGDMPLTEKWRYGYSKHSIWFSPPILSGRKFFKDNVQRGEVVVFKSPEDNDTNVVKRVIGLPGDRVRVENGVVIVNNVRAQLTFKKKMFYKDTNAHLFYELMIYDEVLPLSKGVKHAVAYQEERRDSDVNNFAEETVPEGHYFVMGDNRDCSKDSRCGLGLVPTENLMGRAVATIYSIDNGVRWWEFWLWLQNIRYSRIFKKII
ncbi:MAG: signal peptidase I [Holosporaceae bacterium]|jgi:signal peptidase I|nr:signal peptidase I [Holosporaceae bacterium]